MSASPSGALPRTSVRWKIFCIIFLITLINLVDRISLSIAMPTISKEMNLSPALQGLILSSFFWSYTLLQLPGGWLIDKIGARRVIAGATLLWGGFQALMGVVTGGIGILLMRFGLGAAEAPLFPAGSKLNASWLSKSERARGAVLMDAGSPFGAAIGGLLIAQLILAFDSWRGAFVVAGLLTVAASWLAWRYLRDDPAAHPGVNAAELAHIRGETQAASAQEADGEHAPLPKRSVVAMCIGRASWAMIFFGLLTWGPSYLAQARGLDLKGIGASTFFIFLSAAIGSLVGGFLCDTLVARGVQRGRSIKGMVLVSGIVMLLALIALPRISAPMQAVAMLCATAFFLMWGSLYWSLPSLLVPRQRVGLVGSSMNCAGSVGGVLIPIITGLLLQATGSFHAVILFFGGCALVYVIATLFIGLNRTR